MGSTPIVRAEELIKDFGDVRAVNGISFEIEEGEFFSLVGPSGCGKTTTLRMIAGFEKPTDGDIHIADERVNETPPYGRDTGMVFQGYALFPHKTVGENVGFGLKMEGVPEEERADRVADVLDLVNLPGYEERYPSELSGGQQQRIALARALVIEPSVLLLDEPLSNLDLKLRKQMRFELKRIQQELGVTTIYVTHDQEEALSMSDRVLVMNDGEAEQIDDSLSIYNEPATEFVADFIGEANLFDGTVVSQTDAGIDVDLDDIGVEARVAANGVSQDGPLADGTEVTISVRPENVSLSESTDDVTGTTNRVRGTIRSYTFLGKVTRFLIDVNGEELLVEVPGRAGQRRFESGDSIVVTWDPKESIVVGA